MLALLACLLVAAASVDDFCLPRLLFPFMLPATEVLPLDDPNTDFVEARDPAPVRRAERPVPGGPDGLCLAAPSSTSQAGRLPGAAAFAHAPRARLPERHSPLRC